MSKSKMIPVNRERIQQAIEDMGVSQTGIALELDLNYQAFNKNINSGQLTGVVLFALSAYLNRSPEWLSGESDKPESFISYMSDGYGDNTDDAIIRSLLVSLGLPVEEYNDMQLYEKSYMISELHELMAFHLERSKQKREKYGRDKRPFILDSVHVGLQGVPTRPDYLSGFTPTNPDTNPKNPESNPEKDE